MKTLFCTLATILLCAGILPAQDEMPHTLLGFYPIADSISLYPDVTQELSKICQKKIDGHYVTFIGRKNEKKIFMAAVTLKPIKDVNREISRIVNWEGPRPNAGKVTTWGYVFDRNNDGKIDYMALVGGAGAFEDEKMRPDYPPRGHRVSQEDMQYYLGHSKIIFNHWADDNFDGKIDGCVQVDADSARDFVKQRIVVLSPKFDGRFEEVWGFQGTMTPATEQLPVPHTGESVPYIPPGKGRSEITKKLFDEKTALLQLLNQAAATCKIGSETPTE